MLKSVIRSFFKRIKIRHAIWITIMEYFDNTSLHGFRIIAEVNRPWLERIMKIIVQISAITWSIILVLNAWSSYTTNPTFTTLVSQQYPIINIPFPGIAICSNNKISKEAAAEYAAELNSKTMNTFPDNYLMEKIRYLGRLYDYDSDSRDEYTVLQDILDQIDVNATTGWFDTRSRMVKLSPKCENLLLKCGWDGEYRNCTELFETKFTIEGSCCTFNYIDDKGEPIRTKSTGSSRGLVVVLNASIDDYYYPLLNNEGFNVQIFDPFDFADSATGGFSNRLVNPSTEVLIKLDVSTVQAEKSVSYFSVNQRACRFADELNSQFDGYYSYSNCLLKCRMRSLILLCGCLPFFLPEYFKDGITDNIPKCNLNNIFCLNKYKIKLRLYYPPKSDQKGLEGDLEDTISCPECLPLCSNIYYKVSVETSSITSYFNRNLLTNITNVPVSIIRIFYPKKDALFYKMEVVSTWYNLLSNFGGILALCTGFSLLSAVEFFYFMSYRFFKNLFQRKNQIPVDRFGQQLNLFRTPRIPTYREMETVLTENYNNGRYFYFLK